MIHSPDTHLEQRRHVAQIVRRQGHEHPTPSPLWMRRNSKPGFGILFDFLAIGSISLSFACVEPVETSSTQTEQETNPGSNIEDSVDTGDNKTISTNTSAHASESSSNETTNTSSAGDTSSNSTSDTTDSDSTEMEVPVVMIDAQVYGEDLPQIWAVESTPIALAHCAATKLRDNAISIAKDAVEAQHAQAVVYADYYHPITSFSSGGDEQISVVFLNEEKPPYLDAEQWLHNSTDDEGLIIPRAFYSEQPFYRVQLYPSPHIVPIDPLATLDDSKQTISIEYRILDTEGVVYSVREAHTLTHESMFARQGDFTIWDCQ